MEAQWIYISQRKKKTAIYIDSNASQLQNQNLTFQSRNVLNLEWKIMKKNWICHQRIPRRTRKRKPNLSPADQLPLLFRVANYAPQKFRIGFSILFFLGLFSQHEWKAGRIMNKNGNENRKLLLLLLFLEIWIFFFSFFWLGFSMS